MNLHFAAALLFCAVSVRAMPSVTIPVAPVAQPADELTKKATDACTKALTDPAANKLVPPAPFIKNCIDDVKLSGTFTFVDGHKAAYFAKVKAAAAAALADAALKECTHALTFQLAAENKTLPPAPYIDRCVGDAKSAGAVSAPNELKVRNLYLDQVHAARKSAAAPAAAAAKAAADRDCEAAFVIPALNKVLSPAKYVAVCEERASGSNAGNAKLEAAKLAQTYRTDAEKLLPKPAAPKP